MMLYPAMTAPFACALFFLLQLPACQSFVPTTPQHLFTTATTDGSSFPLYYEPKWKKKETLGGSSDGSFVEKGLQGSIPVLFRQGNTTQHTMALPGQPLRDVASQAGQFIKYGCGKGECGTCEALVNGQWIRPCVSFVPASVVNDDEAYTVTLKDTKSKAKSSGTFFSIRSFFMGFWNNALGMVGFVRYRRHAQRNWEERQEYEDLVRRKTLERKQRQQQSSQNNNNVQP